MPKYFESIKFQLKDTWATKITMQSLSYFFGNGILMHTSLKDIGFLENKYAFTSTQHTILKIASFYAISLCNSLSCLNYCILWKSATTLNNVLSWVDVKLKSTIIPVLLCWNRCEEMTEVN